MILGQIHFLSHCSIFANTDTKISALAVKTDLQISFKEGMNFEFLWLIFREKCLINAKLEINGPPAYIIPLFVLRIKPILLEKKKFSTIKNFEAYI